MTIKNAAIIQSGAEYFDSILESAIDKRGLSVKTPVLKYLSNMLTYYVDARNLHEPDFDESGRKNPKTLAELWLTAQTSEPYIQKELLKKLGDRSLYISGFFSESLNRSLVDLDYYQSMGTTAYKTLAYTSEQTQSAIFTEISNRFIEFAELFNIISHDSFAKTDQGILRLYESYLRTGSSLAKEKLETLGVFAPWTNNLKKITGH